MKVSFAGKTRIVLIFEKKVVKIARIRLLRVSGHLIKILYSPKFQAKFYERYGATFGVALWRDLFWGFYANRNEAHADPTDRRIAPTLASFCYNFINIQEKGLPVSEEELAESCPFDRSQLVGLVKTEMNDPHQYCRISGRGIVLADYGAPVVRDMLRV